MAKKMRIGSIQDAVNQEKSTDYDDDDGLAHSSALAVMFASSVPTPDDLAQLKQKKKVSPSPKIPLHGWAVRLEFGNPNPSPGV